MNAASTNLMSLLFPLKGLDEFPPRTCPTPAHKLLRTALAYVTAFLFSKRVFTVEV